MPDSRAYALSGSNLVSFNLANPSVAESVVGIVGMTSGETLVGIDFRPLNGLLYGLGVNAATDTGTLYVISTRTGQAGVVGTFSGAGDLTAGNYGVDFNPAVDRIRVTSDTGLNFRINPNTGALAGSDTAIAGSVIIGAAYTNNQPENGNITTLYTLDSSSDFLMIQNPPNGGIQNPVGATGVNFSNVNGFDIQAGINAPASNAPVTSGTGFALLTVAGTVGLYGINLVTGAATSVGSFLDGITPAGGLALQNSYGGIPTVGLSADGANLIRFNTVTPGTTATVAVSGVFAGETLVGIDYRPQTGQLFGLGVNAAADNGTLYRIDPMGGAATAIGAAGGIAFVAGGSAVDLPSGGYGVDFNPTVDRIRITTDSGLNFRLNPNNGAAVDGDAGSTGINPDGAITGLPAGATGVSANAYTNSYAQPAGGPTTLYTLDATSNALFIQNPANSGTQVSPRTVTLGGNALDFTSVNGFDIPTGVEVTTSGSPAADFGIAALTVGGVNGLYAINLMTGTAISLGTIGTGATGLAGLALAAPPAVRTGTAGDESFIAFGGNERIDASGGIDTITFGFKLADATVTYAGNQVIVDSGSNHTVLTGFERFVFNDGTVDNNDGNPLIDDLFYYSRYRDVFNAQVDAEAHYNAFGRFENRDPDAFFSTSFYLSTNPDVKAAGVNPVDHFDAIGFREGRLPSTRFDPAQYLAANPDVAAAGVDPLAHFLQFGAGEGRQPFAPTSLIAANGFDYVFYLNNNPDVAAAGVDPLAHFLAIGWTEGRNPNALFDVNGYLSTYADVDAANVNPLVHYDVFGWREGRDPSADFDTTSYRAAYPDVAAANVNPLTHFLQFGMDEGRLPFGDGVFG